jgi:hypothetical protein
MNQPINDGGPAFPTATLAQKTEGGITLPYQPTPYYPIVSVTTTKTLRDEFAMAALQGLLADGGGESWEKDAANAYKAADAMLKAREVKL